MPRTAVVTGAARGLGAAIAKRLAADGDRVLLAATVAPEQLEALLKAIPVGRLGRPEEVAAAVAYLASDAAGFATGTTLDVNGGMLMR